MFDNDLDTFESNENLGYVDESVCPSCDTMLYVEGPSSHCEDPAGCQNFRESNEKAENEDPLLEELNFD